MNIFLSLIFLASIFSSWYFWKKKPNKQFLSGSIAALILSFLLIGSLPQKTEKANTIPAKVSKSVKKDSSVASSKRASEESAKAKSESEKEASLAKAQSEEEASSKASESSAIAASQSSAEEASEQATSQPQENDAQTFAQEPVQSESQTSEEAPVQNNDNTGNAPTTQNPPVNNGDLNTADANAQGVIVGNSRSMIYHVPGQRGYKMNSENAVYFNSEAEAQAAGYRKSLR